MEDDGKELSFDGMHKKADISSVSTSLEDNICINRSKGEGGTNGLINVTKDLNQNESKVGHGEVTNEFDTMSLNGNSILSRNEGKTIGLEVDMKDLLYVVGYNKNDKTSSDISKIENSSCRSKSQIYAKQEYQVTQ